MKSIIIVLGEYAKVLRPWESIGTPKHDYSLATSFDEVNQDSRNSVVGIWLELGHLVTRDTMEYFPNLKFICTSTTGTSHIDKYSAQKKGVEIISLANYPSITKNITSTSELTWLLIMSVWRNLLHKLFDGLSNINHIRYQNLPYELKGKTLGIIGFGRIGKQVSVYARSFGVSVQTFDPYADRNVASGLGVLFNKSLEDLLATSDIILLSASKSDNEVPILSEKTIQRIKSQAVVVNTARGSLWDEQAIAEALTSGRISGIGVDVYAQEELLGCEQVDYSPLSRIDDKRFNIIRTAHIGGATREALERVTLHMYQVIEEQS